MKNGLKILAVAFLVGMGVSAAFADDEADARALCEEANRYFFVEKNYEKAVDCYKRAAFRGNAVAMFNLAACYLRGKGVEQNSTIAFDWYEKSADKGYTQAMYNLALCYEYGNGVEKNLPESFLWFKRAAQRHFPPAMFNLARCYENAKGTRRDLKKAALWYEKAAEANHVKAMVKIANCYESGRGIHKNLMAAFDWYLKAAEKDNTEAMFNVATCYRTGKGVPTNKTHAFEWYKKAAEAEYANAMANLATCYYFGDGVEKNLEEAARWYRAAAQKGNDLAMLNLAECYRKGEGVEQDLGLAIDWLTKAADRGNKFAEAKLAEWTKLEDAVAENDATGSGDALVAGEPTEAVPAESLGNGDTLVADVKSIEKVNLEKDISVPASAEVAKADDSKISEKVALDSGDKIVAVPETLPENPVPAETSGSGDILAAGTQTEAVPAESLGNGDTLVADSKSIEKVDLEKDISVPVPAEIAKADEVKVSEKVVSDSGDKIVAVPETLVAVDEKTVPAESTESLGNGDTLVADSKNPSKTNLENPVPAEKISHEEHKEHEAILVASTNALASEEAKKESSSSSSDISVPAETVAVAATTTAAETATAAPRVASRNLPKKRNFFVRTFKGIASLFSSSSDEKPVEVAESIPAENPVPVENSVPVEVSSGSGDILVAGTPSVPVEPAREEATSPDVASLNLPNDKISQATSGDVASLRADVPEKTVPAESVPAESVPAEPTLGNGDTLVAGTQTVPAESILGNGDTLVADAKSVEKVNLEKDISVPASAEVAKADEVKVSEKVVSDSGDKIVAVPETLPEESVPAEIAKADDSKVSEKVASDSGDKIVAVPETLPEESVPAEIAKADEVKVSEKVALDSGDKIVAVPENAVPASGVSAEVAKVEKDVPAEVAKAEENTVPAGVVAQGDNEGVVAPTQVVAEIAKAEKVAKKPRRRMVLTNPDENIPENPDRVADNVLAFIIANERYSIHGNDVSDVDYAINDGEVFYKYLNKTLGVPAGNICYIENASFGKMRSVILKEMNRRMKDFKGAEVIFYYAGHGVPDPFSGEVYLLPVDTPPEDMEVAAIALSQLYKQLAEFESNRVCVILDACFTGSQRNGGPLASNERGVRIAPRPMQPGKNTIIFAAASGKETAATLPRQKHGLFTYCLLNKLKDCKGDISYQALGDYLRDEVPKYSWQLNNREQHPSVSCGTSFDPSWKFAAESE